MLKVKPLCERMSVIVGDRSLQLILTAVARPRLHKDQSHFLLVDGRPVPGRSADVILEADGYLTLSSLSYGSRQRERFENWY